MRKIDKGPEPDFLRNWKRDNPGGNYNDFANENDGEERRKLNRRNIDEQFAICAYCCKRIDEKNSMNEHVEARQIAPHRQLDFANIVASCTTRNQCDDAHKAQPLPLTPLMDACEVELKFFLSGKVEGLSDRAQEAVRVLNLDNRNLRGCRKQAVDALLYAVGLDPNENDVDLLDDDLIDIAIEDLKSANEEQVLQAYSPVLVNILEQLRV